MKKPFLFTLVTLFALVLAACGNGSASSSGGSSTSGSADGSASTSPSNQKGVVTIGYQKGNTLNILKEHGNLDKALSEKGYKVEWKVFPTGTVLLEALNTNNIDFGHASDGNAVFMQAGGHPLNYVASESPYPEGVALVVKADSEIQSVNDLKGKTIGVTKGGNQHYLLLVALEKAGIAPNEVNIKFYKDAAEGLAAFTKGEFDVYGTWDPYLAIVENTVKTRTIVNGSGNSENRTFYFATKDLLDKKPEVVTTILQELQNADAWANENKQEISKILSTELGLDIAPLQKANDRRTFGVQQMDEAIIASQQKLADKFVDAGLLDAKINIKDAVHIDKSIIPSNIK
ncbi:aliphatic sulfonate ABC transporter substrate-binding protein [Paenibacillus donghaensis]|uniref:aliphatic sulfonate ABC transporter substrate-binding protein n=1 Tax=Paenibacillus donghaensis TaxID=414771 RepID=UPI0018846543|nr:aliphatic sulfonate ABC transporter substrate-binding protein [Paenibacillus donghaensis]MBE9916886.1 aliphatic sulfonate ABC transporter substrate-binding protein [Paenibacillus donghaensis]